MAKKGPRKRCDSEDCRRLRLNGSTYCRFHQSKPASAEVADENVVKLSERDALRFGKVDAEVRNAIQGQKLIDYEINVVQQNVRQKIAELQQRKAELINVVREYQGSYQAIVQEIAETYGIHDPAKMAIDPDAGIVRDLTKV